jgi:hypothetical protein
MGVLKPSAGDIVTDSLAKAPSGSSWHTGNFTIGLTLLLLSSCGLCYFCIIIRFGGYMPKNQHTVHSRHFYVGRRYGTATEKYHWFFVVVEKTFKFKNNI